MRFQGQWYDEESGLHYNFHRYYDPQTGRYISNDPIGLAGGFNTYGYVHNPLAWADPFGLDGEPIIVLGEGQAAVDETTRILRNNGYNAESMGVPKPQWRGGSLPFDTPDKLQRAIDFNRGWLNEKMDQSYRVVTIGEDGRNSVFYRAEMEEIARRGYPKTTLKKLPGGETIGDLRGRLSCK